MNIVKKSTHAVINKIRPLIFSYVFLSINYLNASWYWCDGGVFMTSLWQLKRFEARISLFKSLDCPLALAAAGMNQRFTRYPPVINHNLGWCNSNWCHSPEAPNLGQIWRFLEPRDLEIWQMTLQNNTAPLLCYFKLCASFGSHWWIQTWVTVQKRPIWVKFDDL